ncbi:MAG: hypothetical protein ACJAYG_000513 [Oceanicoccus sp.]|jgi:hypothetical protein
MWSHPYILGTCDQPHATIANAGLFVLEDYPELLAKHAIGFMQLTSNY